MQLQRTFLVSLLLALLGGTSIATAQTGEFGGQVPGRIVHDGWEMQDRLQRERSAAQTKSTSSGPSSDQTSSVRSKIDVKTTNGTKTRD